MGLQQLFLKVPFSDGALKGTREQINAVKEKIIAYLCKAIQEENAPP